MKGGLGATERVEAIASTNTLIWQRRIRNETTEQNGEIAVTRPLAKLLKL